MKHSFLNQFIFFYKKGERATQLESSQLEQSYVQDVESPVHVSPQKEEDTVVPRYALPQLLNAVKSIGEEYGFQSVCYGHAGDGNLHVNILKNDMDDEKWESTLPDSIRKIFEEVKQLGGTLSGEHGIGLVQRDYMDIVFSATHLDLMRSVKSVFDPKGILNPGKIF